MTADSAERAIGKLEGKLDSLLSEFSKNTEKSEEGRARIYGELERMRTDAAILAIKVEAMNRELQSAAPIISDINKWRERIVGMMMLVGAIGAFIGGGVAIFWKWLSAKIGF